jgi:YD repeat-containing protein
MITRFRAGLFRFPVCLWLVLACCCVVPNVFADNNTYVYDANYRVIGVVYANGATAAYTYDADGNITSVLTPAAGSLAVLGFSPQAGTVGSAVLVYGQGFSATPASNAVKFNGKTAVVSAATANQLTVTVPTGATTGPVSVAVGASTATSSTPFTVLSNSAPAVSSFAPQVGTAGSPVTITGSRFASSYTQEHVYFNNFSAVVASTSTTTQISSSVPVGATTGPIAVSTQYGTGTSAKNFIVLPASGLPGGVSASSILEVAQTTVGGAAATYPISTASTQGAISFTVASGTPAITISVTASTFPSGAGLYLYGPSNQLVASGSYQSAPADLYAATPTPGIYVLLIVPANGGTGSITLQILSAKTVTGTLTICAPPAGQTPTTACTTAATGAAIALSDTVPAQPLEWTFSGKAGQQVSLAVNAFTGLSQYSTLVLADIDGHTYFNGHLYDGYAGPVTLLVTGTYSITVVPSGTTTGSATLQVFNGLANENAAENGSMTVCAPPPGGAPASACTTQATGAAVTLADNVPGQKMMWSFPATAGEQVSVAVNAYTGLSQYSTLTLSDQNGHTYLNGYLYGSVYGPFTLPTAGTYFITVVPSGVAVGSATLQIFNAAPNEGGAENGAMTICSPPAGQTPATACTAQSSGAAVTLSDNVPGQQMLWTFQGTAGQQVSLAIETYTGLSDHSTITLSDQNGHVYLSNAGLYEYPGYAGPYTLLTTGTYYITGAPAGLTSGGVTLQVFNAAVNEVGSEDGSMVVCAPPNGQTPASACATPATGSAVTLSDNVPGQPMLWTFAGTAGEEVTLAVNTYTGFSSYTNLTMIDQDGRQYLSDDLFQFPGHAGPVTLAMTGTYFITGVPAGLATGSVSLQVFNGQPDEQYSENGLIAICSSPPGQTPASACTTTATGAPVTLSANAIGQPIEWTFQGTVGQQITFELIGYSGLDGGSGISIADQEGNQYLYCPGVDTLSWCSNTYVGPMTLKINGTYYITVVPGNLSIGSATIQLFNAQQNEVGSEAGTLTVDGSAVALADNVPGQQLVWTFAGNAGEGVSLAITAYSGLSPNSTVQLTDQDGDVYLKSTLANAALAGPFTLQVDGTYSITVVPANLAVGTATMQLSSAASGSGSNAVIGNLTIDGSPQALSDTVAGQEMIWNFSGHSGQQISLQLIGYTGLSGNSSINVYDQQGNQYLPIRFGNSLSNFSTFSNPTGFFTLGTNGTYSVVVVPSGTATGSVTLQGFNAGSPTSTTLNINGGPSTLSNTIPGQPLIWTFTGNAGQQINLNLVGYTGLSSNSSINLYDQNNAQYLNLRFGNTLGDFATFSNPTGLFTLNTSGTFSIVVVPSGLATGSVTLQAFNGPPPATATLTVDGPSAALSNIVPGQPLVWTFSGNAGQEINVALAAYSVDGGSSINLYDPRGTQYLNLRFGNNIGDFWNFSNPTGSFMLNMSGTYTIAVVPAGATLGNVTLQVVSGQPSGSGALTIGGGPVSQSDTVLGQPLVWTFHGNQGQQITLNLTGYSGLSGSSSVSLYDALGAEYLSCFYGNNLSTLSSYCAPYGPITLNVTGTYTLVVVPSGTATGSATFQVSSASPVKGTLAICAPASGKTPATACTTPATGAAVTLTNSAVGQQLMWTFPGTEGQQLTFELTGYSGLSGNATVYLYDQYGAQYFSSSLSGLNNTYVGPIALNATGTYTLLVVPGASIGSASFQVFKATALSATSTVGGVAVTLTNNVPGQPLVWTFAGTIGQQISVKLNGYTGLSGSSGLYLYDQQGNLYASNINLSGNGAIGPFLLRSTETYALKLVPYGTGIGSTTVQLVVP